MARPPKTPKIKGVNSELLELLHKQAKALGKKFDTAPVTLSRGGYVHGALSFGSLAIDLISGGGKPPGRMTTVSGPSMSGKSTLLYQTSAGAIQSGIPVIYMDHESSDGDKRTWVNMGIIQYIELRPAELRIYFGAGNLGGGHETRIPVSSRDEGLAMLKKMQANASSCR